MNGHEFDVLSLEANFSDPETTKLLQDICFVNEYLLEGSVTDIDAAEVVNGLYKEFRDTRLKGEQVFLTGEGWIVSSGEQDDEGGLVLSDQSYMRFVDQEVYIHDLVLQQTTDLSEDGVTTTRQLYLHGKTPIEIEDDDDMGGLNLEDCVLAVSPDMLVRHERLTAAKASAWLDLYYPEEKDAVFEICANADDTASALRALSGHVIDSSSTSEKIAAILAENIESYVGDQLRLTTDLPYVVSINGDVQLLSSTEGAYQELSVLSKRGKEFMCLYELEAVHDSESQTIQFWVSGAIVRHGGNGKVSCRLPISSIDSIESIGWLIE